MDLFGKKAAALENVIKSQTATIRRISANELAAQRIKNVLIPEMQKAYREPPLPEQDEETISKLPTGKWISGGNC